MESSSNDSFLWTDASDDSRERKYNRIVQPMETHNKVKFESSSDIEQKKACDAILENNIEAEIMKKRKKTKKRKYSEITEESSDYSQLDKKRIKFESESDIDFQKKKKPYKANHTIANESLYSNDDYLNFRVKQEQLSTAGSDVDQHKNKKNEKNKNQISDTEVLNEESHNNLNLSNSESENYLNFRVKQEQLSVGASNVDKPKKKKKQRNSALDMESTSNLLNTSNLNRSESESCLDLQVKQEQLSVVASDVDKPKKKKKQRNSVSDMELTNNSHDASNLNRSESECCLDLQVKQEQLSVVASDVDKPKKNKKQRNSAMDMEVTNDSHNNSELNKSKLESYLDLRVKEEQTLLDKTKKKKKLKRTNSNTENTGDSIMIEKSSANDLDTHLKQPQISINEPESIKPKKKKKNHKSSVASSELEIASETPFIMETNSSAGEDCTGFKIIEEKFHAEETVVEQRRKKKHKKETVANISNDAHCDSIYNKSNCEIDPDVHCDNINDNDTSIQPSDFTCNNIVSSTIINSSSVDITSNNHKNKTDFMLSSKKQSTKTISDRITFEEDEYSTQHEPVTHRTSARINKFLKANPHLQLYNPVTQKNSAITKDDEIWTLRWPHKIDIEKLKNTTLTLEGKYKIKIDGHAYEGVPNEDVNRITLCIHQHGQALVTSLRVNECIHYHKRIPKAHIPNNNIMVNNQTNFIPLPDTKCRHPLFGAHYKKSIKIRTAVAEHLNAAKHRNSISSSSETIKTKRHKKNKHELLDNGVEEERKQEPLKKKKKRKHSQDYESSHKKPKRIKHDPDSPAVWESEQAIEENLFNF